MVDERGGPNLGFSGAYAQIGYFLTGESRPYDRKKGIFCSRSRFRRVNCSAAESAGSVEVVSQGWSYIDLNDKRIQGGELGNYILGVNWYLSRLAKLQVMYMHSFLEDADTGASDTKMAAVHAQFRF